MVLKIFLYKVLITIEDENEMYLNSILNRLERMYIKKYNTFDRGYNMTIGGRGVRGLKHSEETKKKLSISNQWCKGENHPFYGKTHSKHSIDIIKKKREMQWVDENGNYTTWNKGIPMTDKTKKKYYQNVIKVKNLKIVKR